MTQKWSEIKRKKGYTPDLLELEKFTSDDGQHHVVWGGSGDYPTWWCSEHDQSYYHYCLGGKQITDNGFPDAQIEHI